MVMCVVTHSGMQRSGGLEALLTALESDAISTKSHPPTIMSKKELKRQRSRNPNKTPREHRPMYTQEEADAIMYFRDSVQLPWKKAVKAWNDSQSYLKGEGWTPRTISGLQSHYYRMLGFEKGGSRRSSAPNPEIGLLKTTNRRYWWCYGSNPSIMEELKDATPEQLKHAAKQHVRRLRREVHKEGRQRKLAKRVSLNDVPLKCEELAPAKSEQMEGLDNTFSYSGDGDSVSSITNSFEKHSIELEGYESSSNDAPPSSKSSAPPYSPSVDFMPSPIRHPSEGLTSNAHTLPPCSTLGQYADEGCNKIEVNRGQVVPWRERVETLQVPRPQEAFPVSVPTIKRNPMSVASLLAY